MVKEAVEDYKRHKQDVEVNNRAVEVSAGAASSSSSRRRTAPQRQCCRSAIACNKQQLQWQQLVPSSAGPAEAVAPAAQALAFKPGFVRVRCTVHTQGLHIALS
jgi:hypothetical protein